MGSIPEEDCKELRQETIQHDSEQRRQGQKLSTVDKRERKRATDRESQRLSRARTKAYITQLEQAVQGLNDKNAPEASSQPSTSTAQLMQVIEENQQLKTALSKVNRITKQIIGFEPKTEEDASKDPEGDMESVHMMESALKPSSPLSSDNHPQFDHSIWPGIFETALHAQAPLPMFSAPIHGSLSYPRSSHSDLSLDNPALPPNHFFVLNTHLAQLELSDPNDTYTTPEIDDDIAIRAILFGWADARRKHTLDPIWLGLEAFDQAMFYRSRTVERAAVMHVLRAFLVHRVAPTDQPRRQIPSFLKPTQLQKTIDHACLIDYFVWPDLRDTLVLSNANYASELSTAWFATNLRLEWPYRVEDICKYAIATDRYSFTEEFSVAMNELRSWGSPFGDPRGAIVREVFRLPGSGGSGALGEAGGLDDLGA